MARNAIVDDGGYACGVILCLTQQNQNGVSGVLTVPCTVHDRVDRVFLELFQQQFTVFPGPVHL